MAAGVSRQPAPKSAGSEFQHRARTGVGVEEFSGEAANLQHTTKAAAVTIGSLGGLRRYALGHGAAR